MNNMNFFLNQYPKYFSKFCNTDLDLDLDTSMRKIIA